jgi:hypothetical protein
MVHEERGMVYGPNPGVVYRMGVVYGMGWCMGGDGAWEGGSAVLGPASGREPGQARPK